LWRGAGYFSRRSLGFPADGANPSNPPAVGAELGSTVKEILRSQSTADILRGSRRSSLNLRCTSLPDDREFSARAIPAIIPSQFPSKRSYEVCFRREDCPS